MAAVGSVPAGADVGRFGGRGQAWLTGYGGTADAVWLAAAGVGLCYAVWSAAEGLRRGSVGVDVIALLALGSAVAVREFLAAAVIRRLRW